MDWAISGVWGDENMPNIKEETPFFGTFLAAPITLLEPMRELGVLKKAWVSLNVKGSGNVGVEYSLDQEHFVPVEQDKRSGLFGPIEELAYKRNLFLKVHMRTEPILHSGEEKVQNLAILFEGQSSQVGNGGGFDVGVFVLPNSKPF
jgi:hypothetical protein